MKVRIHPSPEGQPIELNGVTRIISYTNDDEPMEFDLEAGPAPGWERTVYVNPANVVCIVIDDEKEAK